MPEHDPHADAERDYSTPRLPSDYFQKPSPARMWNYLQGGKDNYPLDRGAGDAMAASYPEIFQLAQQSRRFLVRAVRYAAEAGVRQFLDIGCGLPAPTDGANTHQVAQRVHPDARVVYVDNDPVVLTHAHALLGSDTAEGRCAYLEADVREVERILDYAKDVLDLDRPVAVILFGVLGAIPMDEALRVLGQLTSRIAPGSYLLVEDGADCGAAEREALEGRAATGVDQYSLRTPEQMAEYFAGLELVDPGLVPISEWRPYLSDARDSTSVSAYGALARKPE